MAKYKIIMVFCDGTEEEQDEVFDTEYEAVDYAGYLCGCYYEGAEILNMSNPGDYPLDDDDEVDYRIIEIDD